ncbi:MAG: hypothetical protein U9M95_06955 [Candidatus Altiarchaeota archaeon]|nr:hypothetical protein [Candidatus Altiarchaeota archaeon]
MNLLADIRLRWYDDSSLMLEDERELIALFLDTLGVSRKAAIDIFEALLKAKKRDMGLTSDELRGEIIKLRRKRGETEKGLTKRNLQIWLRFYRDIELVERFGSRYRFAKNKKPSQAFRDYTKPEVIDKSSDFMYRLLKEIEDRCGVKK